MSIRAHAVRSLLISAAALAVATPAWAQTEQEAQAQAATPRRGQPGRPDHRHRDQARFDGPGRPLLDQCADAGRHPARQRQHDRGHQPQRRRPRRPEPRAGPEPGVGPRRVGRPDRPRPAGREGAGRRLPRRIRHFAVAVHARPRPVRPEPRRDAARPAGHAVRIGQRRRHDPLHHQPAEARPDRRAWSKSTSIMSTTAILAATSRAPSTSRSAKRLPFAPSPMPPNMPASSTRSGRLAGTMSMTASRFGGRLSLLWQPTDELKITPRVVYQKIDGRRLQPRGVLQPLRQPVHDAVESRRARRSATQYLLLREKFKDETLHRRPDRHPMISAASS